MKLVLSGLAAILLSISSVNCDGSDIGENGTDTNSTVTHPPVPTSDPCPPTAELLKTGCLCYPEMNYLICRGTSQTLNFSTSYHFSSLIIRDSPELPFWTEHLDSPNHFQTDSLVIIQTNTPPKITENFKELLRLPGESIKIIANGQIASLDLSYLPKTLNSIAISQVGQLYHGYFAHFYLGDQTKLQHINLNQVRFTPPIVDLFLEGLPLTNIKLIQANLTGKFAYVPTRCPVDNDKIVIDLRGNDLTDFNFAYLFPEGQVKCQYHIDLGGNDHLREDLLTSQIEVLKSERDNLFVSLGGAQLNCSCQLLDLRSENFLHSVHCKDGGGVFLDVATKEDLKCN